MGSFRHQFVTTLLSQCVGSARFGNCYLQPRANGKQSLNFYAAQPI